MELIDTFETTDEQGITWVTEVYRTEGGGTYETTRRKDM